MGDEVSLDRLYKHRDAGLRKLGLEAPARRGMKRPASTQPPKDATGDHKNPKHSKTTNNDTNGNETPKDQALKDKATSGHEATAMKKPAAKKPAAKKPAAVDEDGANEDTTRDAEKQADKAEGYEAHTGPNEAKGENTDGMPAEVPMSLRESTEKSYYMIARS